MRIQHNIMAMNAYRNYTNNVSAMKANLEKLSSGYKINRAGDDAAGLAISEKMRAQITGLETAQKNAKDGISLVQTAEGALTEVHDMLNRMVELATQSANGTYDNTTDRAQLQKEMDQLKEEINRIADSSNFNGIKLLDGSLSTEGVAGANDVKVGKNAVAYFSAGEAGVYKTTDGFGTSSTTTAKNIGKENDQFQYTVSLDDGTTKTVNLTLGVNDKGQIDKLTSDDGTKYTLGTAGKITVGDLDKAVLGELQKGGVADKYVISSDGSGKYTFTAKEVGTSVPAVASADFAYTIAETGERIGNGGTDTGKSTSIFVNTAPRDVGYEIKASELTEYNGTNYDDAVFTINGKKFVLLTNDIDADTDRETANQEYLRAVKGLGDDVTVLVGGIGGLMKPAGTANVDPVAPGTADAANSNFAQNIAAIAKATGLTVTDAIAEATATGAGAGEGIRLSAGKGSISGGLLLQIGDTADSYNQLRVSISDMHTKSLGLDDISIAEQGDAQGAIDAVKKAINKVSDVRGTLGATQNRLDHTINNLSVMTENIQDAESTIRDVDVAEEMMAYTKNNILIQSAQAMLAQANQVPQGVLQLLQ